MNKTRRRYEVTAEVRFSAAHNLRDYSGDCERLHGHNWHVTATVTREELDEQGMVMDFRLLKKLLKGITAGLDHRYLNEVPPFDRLNPTSETIAEYIFQRLAEELPDGVRLASVSVDETPDARAAVYAQDVIP